MFIDIYRIGQDLQARSAPDIISFDSDFLTTPHPANCEELFSAEGIKVFSDLFTPEERKGDNKNRLKRIITSEDIAKSSLVKILSGTVREIKKGRSFVLDNYRVFSPQNWGMMRAGDNVGTMLNIVEYALKNNTDFLAVTHNANPQDHLVNGKGERVELFGRTDSVTTALAYKIQSATIETADIGSETYTGRVKGTDHIEGMYSTSSFVAHPIPEEIGSKEGKRLHVRDRGRNSSAGGHHLTAQPSINRGIEVYVNELVEANLNAAS